MKKFAILFCAFTLCLTACKDETIIPTPVVNDRPDIMNFVETNNFVATETDLGTFLVEEVNGAGDMPTASDRVRVRYVGSYLDGEIFDRTQGDNTADFNMSGVITGFRDGLENMRVGGTTKIIMPSHLGYGSNPPFGIRANAILIFDTELVEIL
ncbi:MAG: FKBP-type peptidyl-prolyl cis-trans isomerase FkpA [Saprospiraceae bacterium]|jgi:FKBP-type peptidyl-prolyl cis-trans isomerase FkpA